ncbi:MAG: zinc-binding alcohol dehydrogenase [Sumerlaeia bacterium]
MSRNEPLTRQAIEIAQPGQVRVVVETLGPPAPGQVRVRTVCSAISAGTERLFFRGEVPDGMVVDSSIAALGCGVAYPLRYGYACAGMIEAVGDPAHASAVGKPVFAFHPHASHFLAGWDELIGLDGWIGEDLDGPVAADFEGAALLPNVETAVSLLQDGAPIVGERVAVIGLGIVGMLTSLQAKRFPSVEFAAIELTESRRDLARALQIPVLAPDEAAAKWAAKCDLVFELSGNPEALNLALDLVAFSGRVVVGSWYGRKRAALDLGGRFHRSRAQIVSSQVSTLAPHLTGRFDKARRMEAALRLLRDVPADRLVTHRFPAEDAAEAFRLLDETPGEALQVLLTYDDPT